MGTTKKKSQCKNVNDLGSGKTSKYAGLNNTGPLKCGFFFNKYNLQLNAQCRGSAALIPALFKDQLYIEMNLNAFPQHEFI